MMFIYHLCAHKSLYWNMNFWKIEQVTWSKLNKTKCALFLVKLAIFMEHSTILTSCIKHECNDFLKFDNDKNQWRHWEKLQDHLRKRMRETKGRLPDIDGLLEALSVSTITPSLVSWWCYQWIESYQIYFHLQPWL